MNFTRRTPRKRLRSSSWMPATAARDNETLDHLLSFRCRDPCYSAPAAIRKCDMLGLVAGREHRDDCVISVTSPTSNRNVDTPHAACACIEIGRAPVRRRDVIALIGGTAASLPLTARAQNFPARAITLVVGFPPG